VGADGVVKGWPSLFPSPPPSASPSPSSSPSPLPPPSRLSLSLSHSFSTLLLPLSPSLSGSRSGVGGRARRGMRRRRIWRCKWMSSGNLLAHSLARSRSLTRLRVVLPFSASLSISLYLFFNAPPKNSFCLSFCLSLSFPLFLGLALFPHLHPFHSSSGSI
jgi:hypothetical protein